MPQPLVLVDEIGKVGWKWLAICVGTTLLQIGVSLNCLMSSLAALKGSPTVWSSRAVIEKAVGWGARHIQEVDEAVVKIH